MLQSGLASRQPIRAIEANPWWQHLLWIGGAIVVGYGVAALFSGMATFARPLFVLAHTLISGGFVFAYFRWSQVDLWAILRRRWLWGVVAAVAVGAFQVRNVLSQPASPSVTGVALLWDLLWLGVVYGAVDAFLLSILPVLATWQAFSHAGWAQGWFKLIIIGVVALVSSLAVTAAYHLGFAEYQNQAIAGPLVGNAAGTLGYLATGNPLAALLSHISMHIAAVLHGPATTVQLPPHY